MSPAFAPAMLPSIPTVAAAPVALANKGTAKQTLSIHLGLRGLIAGACALVLVLRSRAAARNADRVIVGRQPLRAAPRPAAATQGAAPGPAATTSGVALDSARAPASALPSAGAAPPAGAAGATTGGDGNAQALTRVLARRQDQIASCFATRAADVSGTPGLSVRFEVDASGHRHRRARPSTRLRWRPRRSAECIEGVARDTDFGPQAHPLSFRIPMTARRSP